MNNLINILSGKKEIVKIPIWLMRQAGRYLPEYKLLRKEANNFLSFCYNPNLAMEATLQPIRRFDLDAAIIFSDILVIPDSIGVNVAFEESHGPMLEPIRSIKDLDLCLEKKQLSKLDPIYTAIEKTKEKLPKNIPLIGFSGGAWTLASYIVEGKLTKDFSIIKPLYYNNPEFIKYLIDNLVENISKHLINQIKAGVDILQIFDSWAGVLTGNDYEELIIKPTQEIIKKVRNIYPHIPIISFPRMSGLNIQKFVKLVDCDAVSVDQYSSLNLISNEKLVQGNLDPLVLLSNSKDFIKRRVDDILVNMKDINFIFNLGHGVVPNTPPENVEFLVNYVKNYR